MLKLDDVTISYGAAAAVRHLSLHVDAGEVVALIGPNGAGKSTTLNSVAGLLRPKEGSILLDGRSTAGLTPERLVRRGLALVPEGRRIFGSLTVRENLGLGATTRSDRKLIAEDIRRMYEVFPVLERYSSTHADRLSGGEQQQLAIARALVGRPRLLLLDEPSLGLAPIVVDTVFEALRGLRDTGVTMLLVEQSALRAVEFADRSYVLSAGELVLHGTRGELIDHPDLADIYLGTIGPGP